MVYAFIYAKIVLCYHGMQVGILNYSQTTPVTGHIVSTVIKKAFSKRSQDPHIQIYGWSGLNCHYKTH